MSLPKSLLLKHSCMYTKRGGVAAYHVVRIGLCLRSVPGMRVLASAVDDSAQQEHAHLERSSSTNRSKQYDMLPHHHA